MKLVKLGLLLGLTLVLGVLSVAQSTVQYRLRPLDTIQIQVYNEQQMIVALPILPDGRVSAPFAGLIMVAGKTTAEVEEELVEIYKERLKLRDPKVSVMVLQYRPTRASVSGMVLQGGTFPDLRPGDTVITLLSRAGGINPDRADLRRATLTRAGSREVIPIDLHSMLFKNDMSQNYEVEDGDVLFIPEEVMNRVQIQGAIARPGQFLYKEPMYLSDLISLAGGEIPNRTKFSETLVIRRKPGTEDQLIRIKANYVDYVRKGDLSQNVMLMPGDLVFVPTTKTPDYNQLGTIFNTLFFVDRFLTGGIFGFRLFGN